MIGDRDALGKPRGGRVVHRLQRLQRGDRDRIRHLESELRRKEKALAEAAALLVLQKKARAVWGEEDA
jgi:hypothetical protein